ncbi:MAG TPA: TetR/AcrR family transcriptional regulator [Bryobacteraceae bacterium]|nr:TetR/AcrR family transcriptional regulator [Bryobacteraceae bacterium]
MKATPAPAKPSEPRAARMPSEDRRRQLLQVAVDRFARNGFSGTKTKDIAAAAGVSEAILFRHFASKEDLYHAILDEKEATLGADRWYDELKQLAERRDDRALFRHIGRQLLQSFREDAAFHRLLLYASLEGHLLADLFHERFGLPMGDFLTQYVTLRQQEGAFRECDPGTAVMFVFGAMVHYAMSRFVLGVKIFPPDEDSVMDQFVELILGGLELPGKGKKKL